MACHVTSCVLCMRLAQSGREGTEIVLASWRETSCSGITHRPLVRMWSPGPLQHVLSVCPLVACSLFFLFAKSSRGDLAAGTFVVETMSASALRALCAASVIALGHAMRSQTTESKWNPFGVKPHDGMPSEQGLSSHGARTALASSPAQNVHPQQQNHLGGLFRQVKHWLDIPTNSGNTATLDEPRAEGGDVAASAVAHVPVAAQPSMQVPLPPSKPIAVEEIEIQSEVDAAKTRLQMSRLLVKAREPSVFALDWQVRVGCITRAYAMQQALFRHEGLVSNTLAVEHWDSTARALIEVCAGSHEIAHLLRYLWDPADAAAEEWALDQQSSIGIPTYRGDDVTYLGAGSVKWQARVALLDPKDTAAATLASLDAPEVRAAGAVMLLTIMQRLGDDEFEHAKATLMNLDREALSKTASKQIGDYLPAEVVDMAHHTLLALHARPSSLTTPARRERHRKWCEKAMLLGPPDRLRTLLLARLLNVLTSQSSTEAAGERQETLRSLIKMLPHVPAALAPRAWWLEQSVLVVQRYKGVMEAPSELADGELAEAKTLIRELVQRATMSGEGSIN